MMVSHEYVTFIENFAAIDKNYITRELYSTMCAQNLFGFCYLFFPQSFHFSYETMTTVLASVTESLSV